MIRSKATPEWSNDAVNRINMDREKELYAAYVAMHGLSQRVLATDNERRANMVANMFCHCIDNPSGACPESEAPGLLHLNGITNVTRFDGSALPFACMTHNKKIVITHTMEYLNHSVIPKELQAEICESAIQRRHEERRLCPQETVSLFASTHQRVSDNVALKMPVLTADLRRFSVHSCPTPVRTVSSTAVLLKESKWIDDFKKTALRHLEGDWWGPKLDPSTAALECQATIASSFELINEQTMKAMKPADLLLAKTSHYNLDQVSESVDWSFPITISHELQCGTDTKIRCANIPVSVAIFPEITGTVSVQLPAQDEDYLWLPVYEPVKQYTFLASDVRCPNYRTAISNTTQTIEHGLPYCRATVKETLHVTLPDLDPLLDYTNLTFSRIQGTDAESIAFTPRVIDAQSGTELLNEKNVLRLTDTLAMVAVDTTSVGLQAAVDMRANQMQFKFVRSDPTRGPCSIWAYPVYSWSAISECGAFVRREEYVNRIETLLDLSPVDAPVFRVPLPLVLTLPGFDGNSAADVEKALLDAARNYIRIGYIQAVSESINGSLNAVYISALLVTDTSASDVQCILTSSSNVTFRLTASDACGKSRSVMWTPVVRMDSAGIVPIASKPLIYRKVLLCHDPVANYDGIAVDIEQLKKIVFEYSRLKASYVIRIENGIIQTADYYMAATRTLGSSSRTIDLFFRLTTVCGTTHDIQIVLTVAGPSMSAGVDWCRSYVAPTTTAKFELANPRTTSYVSVGDKKYVLAFVKPEEAVRVAHLAGVTIETKNVMQSYTTHP